MGKKDASVGVPPGEVLWGHDSTVQEMSTGTVSAVGSGSHGGQCGSGPDTARHQDGDSVDDGTVSRRVMGSGGGVVGRGVTKARLLSAMTLMVPQECVDCGVHEGDVAVTCSKDTRGQGRMVEGLHECL